MNVVPFPGIAADVDLTAMSGEDLADDRQAQPRTAGLLTPGDPVELLEDSRQVLARDPLAGVLDAESDGVAFRPDLRCGSSPRAACAGWH